MRRLLLDTCAILRLAAGVGVLSNRALTALEVMSKSIDLPLFHRDPADRFIIATALLNNLVVVTTDHRFGQYGVEVLS